MKKTLCAEERTTVFMLKSMYICTCIRIVAKGKQPPPWSAGSNQLFIHAEHSEHAGGEEINFNG